MSFRHRETGHLRRRRVLGDRDDTSTAPLDGAGRPITLFDAEAAERPRVTPYGDAGFLHTQPRWIDLIPRRPSTFIIAGVVGGLVIALWIALVGWFLPHDDLFQDIARPLQFGTAGSLAGWIGSLGLIAAGLTSCLIFSIRQHRQDDYRATYRVWGWTAAFCFLASIEQATELRQSVARSAVLLELSEGHVAILWTFAAWSLTSVLVVRLLGETRYCRAAQVLILAVLLLYTVAIGLDATSTLLGPIDARPTLAVGAALCDLIGHGLLLMTTLVFGRFVLMEAEGLVRTPTTLETVRRKANAAPRVMSREPEVVTKPETVALAELEAGEIEPGAEGVSREEPRPVQSATVDDGDPPAAAHPMSKAERKALRRARREAS